MASVVSNAAPRTERGVFFTWMAAAIAVAVFAGFARTYYLKGLTGAPPLPSALVYWHAAVFTAWVMLFIVQTNLVANNRIRVHRQLGIVAGAIATAMIVLGYVTSIEGARRGFIGQFPDEASGFIDPLAFLILGLGDILLFAVFVTLGFYFRRKPQMHKRLMLLATLNLVPAALIRLPLGPARIPFAALMITGFLLAGPIHDWRLHRRIHPVFVWGGLVTFISGPLRPLIGNTVLWHRIAGWLCA